MSQSAYRNTKPLKCGDNVDIELYLIEHDHNNQIMSLPDRDCLLGLVCGINAMRTIVARSI